MKKIIALAGSSSKTSINKRLATYAANQFENASVEVLDLNDYEMPVYSVDKEKWVGDDSLLIKKADEALEYLQKMEDSLK